MKGERTVLNWVVDNIDTEEKKHSTWEQNSPAISAEDLNNLLHTTPAPHLRIPMTVAEN